jgi:uncharacterized protein (TIGR01777 family)
VLEASGHEVVRLVRRSPRRPHEVEWDPTRKTIDSAALAGVSGAVNLSGSTIGRRWTKARKAEIRSSRVASTRLLAETLARLEPRPAVLVSAGGTHFYGDRGDEILTEESSPGTGFLAEVVQAWEEAAEPAREAGIRVVSFRQGIVLTGAGGVLERLRTPFRLGVGGRVGDGRQWWSWVASDDLAAAYELALTGELEGPVNLASPGPVTNAQFTKALGRALGRPTVVPFPALAARTVFGEMAEEVLLGSQRVLPARLLDAGFTFRYPSLDAALARALAD